MTSIQEGIFSSYLQKVHTSQQVTGQPQKGENMVNNPLKVLFVEDNEDHAFLVYT
jgi:hypothetical protein